MIKKSLGSNRALRLIEMNIYAVSAPISLSSTI